MEQLGWNVVVVHYKDWILANTPKSRTEFLSKIAAIVLDVPARDAEYVTVDVASAYK